MRSILILASLLLALPAWGQGNQLVGTWKAVSNVTEFKDTGEKRPVFGDKPVGYVVFTSNGRVSALITPAGRKPPQTDAERAAAFQSMFAVAGTYRVKGDKYTVKMNAAWNEANVGKEFTRSWSVKGDRLIINTDWSPNPNFGGRESRAFTEWVRDK